VNVGRDSELGARDSGCGRRPSAIRNPQSLVFALLLATFLAYRLLLLWGSPVLEPDFDEMITGLLPDHLLHGLFMPVYMHQYSSHTGGVVVEGLMSYFPFRWLGETAFALRLAPLFFSTLLLVLLFLLAHRYFGPAVAFLAAAFCTFPPRYCLDRSLRAFANHAEIATFVLGGMFLYMLLNEGHASGKRWDRRRVALLAGLGATTGFGVYFCYLNLIFLLAVPALLWRGAGSRRDFLADAGVFVAGFAAGFSPWLLYHRFDHDNVLVHFASGFTLSAAGRPWVVNKNPLVLLPEVWQKLTVTWLQADDVWWGESLVVRGWVLDAALLTVFAAAWLRLTWQARGALAAFFRGLGRMPHDDFFTKRERFVVPLLLYLPWHFLGFVFWPGGGAGYPRYLHPEFPFLFLIVALFVVDLWRRRWRRTAAVVAAIVLIADLAGSREMWRNFAPGVGARWPGHAYSMGVSMFNRWLSFRDPGFDPPQFDRIAKAFFGGPAFAAGIDAAREFSLGDDPAIDRNWPVTADAATQHEYVRGVGFVRWATLPTDLPHMRNADRRIAADERESYWDGMLLLAGEPFLSGFVAGVAYLEGRAIDGHVAAARDAGPGNFAPFVAGLGAASVVVDSPRPERQATVRNFFPAELAPQFDRGVALGRGWRRQVTGVSASPASP